MSHCSSPSVSQNPTNIMMLPQPCKLERQVRFDQPLTRFSVGQQQKRLFLQNRIRTFQIDLQLCVDQLKKQQDNQQVISKMEQLVVDCNQITSQLSFNQEEESVLNWLLATPNGVRKQCQQTLL